MKRKTIFTVLLAALFYSLCINPVSAVLSTNLDGVIVYPNPCRSKLGETTVTFDNLTSSVKLRIYKKTGELIYDKDLSAPGGNLIWDVINNDGYPVASGIYIYLITNKSGQQAKGKLAILK